MTSLLTLGTRAALDRTAAELAERIAARGFAEPRPFLRLTEQLLVDHPIAQALVLPAGSTIAGDLQLDYDALAANNTITAVVARGDLAIEGRLLNDDPDGGPILIVEGNLRARQIVTGGAQILVLGSVASRELVFCDYNHGRFIVAGDLDAPALILNDQTVEVAGKLPALVVGEEEGNLRECLVLEVFADPYDPEDEWPDGNLVRERLAAGLPILKSG